MTTMKAVFDNDAIISGKVSRDDLLPGFITAGRWRDKVLGLYRDGSPSGDSTGWSTVEELYKPAALSALEEAICVELNIRQPEADE